MKKIQRYVAKLEALDKEAKIKNVSHSQKIKINCHQ